MSLYEILYLSLQGATVVSWGVLIFVMLKVKRKTLQTILVLGVMFTNAFMAALIFYEQNSRLPVAESSSLIQGDFWTIEDVFSVETDIALRSWKRNLLIELSTNLNTYRAANDLVIVALKVVESFGPEALNQVLESDPQSVYLLDVRESAEFDRFHLPGSINFRYGDLANNNFPNLPKDQKIVVVCYSGIRGYVVANLLREQGYDNVSFIRGGLGAWQKAGLSVWGDEEDFKFLFQQYPQLPKEVVASSPRPKIDFSFPQDFDENLFTNSYNFYGELATKTQVEAFMEPFIGQSVILVCHSESQCFDGAAFAYEFRKNKGSILGYIELK